MKPAKTMLAVLLVATCFTCALEARAATSGTYLIPALERGDLRDAQPSGWALRVQLRTAAPTQPKQVQAELLVEGDPPFESNKPVQFDYTYQAVVYVREQPSEGQGTPVATSSSRAMPRVVIQAGSRTDVHRAVRLIADPVEIQAGNTVRLQAHVEPEAEGVVFVFDFGDGQRSESLPDNIAVHRYASPGAYLNPPPNCAMVPHARSRRSFRSEYALFGYQKSFVTSKSLWRHGRSVSWGLFLDAPPLEG